MLPALGVCALSTSIATAASTLDVDGNLPAAADGSTTTLADGTTLTLTEYAGGPAGGLGSIYPNTSASDFDFGSSSPGVGNWGFIALEVTFGTDFGVSGDGLVSAADFELGVSSLNGSSNWYEWGFIDLEGPGGSITVADVQSYLGVSSNYTAVDPTTEIGTVLGANAANDEHNNGGAGGSSGSGPSNDVWNNTDFGLDPEEAISGFTFYYGAVTSDSRSSSPGASIANFEDAMTTQAVIPEPSSFALLALAGMSLFGIRRR